ncbi:HD domain-containing protein [Klebsiella pneumoniae]|uniref:HD domain-containing protein n=1 Tax=Klebsiella pneumoniae TaxID=573 RepID=UPI00294ADEFA|nr:HD domain-containing protein [Klebsiella pneumoniae]
MAVLVRNGNIQVRITSASGLIRSIVAWYGGTVEMQIAALLHDVVEDTHVTIEMVREHFGERVAEMVLALTNIAKPEDGNRVQRFVINVLELSTTLCRHA